MSRQTIRNLCTATLIVVLPILICLVAVWVVGSLLADEIFPGLQSMYHSDSMKPLKLRLGPNRVLLRIPAAYIYGLDPGKNGTYATIQFTAFLPDMATEQFYNWDHPLLAADDHQANLNQSRDWLQIELDGSDWSNATDAKKKFSNEINFFRAGSTKVPVSQFPDYDVYVDYSAQGMKPGYDYRKARTILYVPKLDTIYYILCFDETQYDGKCNLSYNYKDEFRVEISFEPADLPQAFSIKNLVTSFLDAATAAW